MDLNQFSTVDIVLDKANDNFIQKQTISAGDRNGRSLTLQVTDAGSIGEVPGLTANLLWTNHSSGLSDLSAFSVVDRTTSLFKIEYPQNMLTAGKVTAQIQLLHNGKVTHSKKFEIIVLDIAGKLKGVLQTAEYTTLVEALAKANEFETDIAEVTAQLAQKVGMGKKAELEDLSPTVLSAIQGGEGTEFNLLSIPQDDSVGRDKLDTELRTDYELTLMKYPEFNLFDESVAVVSGEFKTSGPVAVPSNSRICISTKGGHHGYIDQIDWLDINKEPIVPAPTLPLDFLNFESRSGKFLTTPSNCKYITFRWRFVFSGGNLARDMMVYVVEGRDYIAEYEPYTLIRQINPELLPASDSGGSSVGKVYVSTSGSDSNDGKTPETAFGSFARASAEKPTIIYAERGVYKYDRLTINDQDSFTLLPYTNDDVYSHDKPIRSKIVIDNGNILTNLTLSDGLLEQVFAGGAFFNQVFIDKTMEPMLTSRTPRAVLWQEFDDETLNTRLKPVLTKQEVSEEIGTFTWDGTKIFINPLDGSASAFVVAHNPTSVLDIKNTKTVAIEDVEGLYQFYNNVNLHNVGSSDVKNTHAKYANSGQGFSIDNTNANLYNCTAFKVGNDGFNMHGYGDTNFFNCKGTYCYDDGMSHHSGCNGTVHGGEYSFNGKGGILPAYGANVDIYNTICKGNPTGIGYLYTPNGHAPAKGFMSGNALIDNNIGLHVGATNEVTAVSTVYAGNVTDKTVDGVLNEH